MDWAFYFHSLSLKANTHGLTSTKESTIGKWAIIIERIIFDEWYL